MKKSWLALILAPCFTYAAYPIYEGKYEERKDVQLQEEPLVKAADVDAPSKDQEVVKEFSVTDALNDFEEAMVLKKEALQEEAPIVEQECTSKEAVALEPESVSEEVVAIEQESVNEEIIFLFL